jgi:putative oxygen-independent coproporphyrinogen III oxidase
VRASAIDQERYVAAFKREIAHQKAMVPDRRVSSVFFGGGTPSLMQPRTVAAIIDAIAAAWSMDPAAEITLEANPTSVEAERFKGYRAAGVNRVSLGVQAMNDADLKALGRLHSVAEAMAAVDVARSIFQRYSFDLIYARPGQTLDSWRAELEDAIARAAEHLSLYQLTIEPGTAFEKLHLAGKLAMPDPELGRNFYDLTAEICEKHGLPAYEISNHARPGAECRHNLVYWRYGEYAAIGPGAHGRLITAKGRRALSNEKSPETWLGYVEADGHGIVEEEGLSVEAQGDEFLLMGLRLREGVSLSRFKAITGKALDPERIAFLVDEKLIAWEGDRLRVTAEGFPVLDAVVADLAA